jgi:CNT family concentrative nucleoside transporter
MQLSYILKTYHLQRFTGLIGIALILGLSFLLSNNRKAISLRVVFTGLGLQLLLAFFVLKTATGQKLFAWLGSKIEVLLAMADKGGEFAFGGLVHQQLLVPLFGKQLSFIFIFKLIPVIIFVMVLASILYHLGIMQRVVALLAGAVNLIMGVSGSEALSNISSVFVGQVEAQIVIKPYLSTMTMSEMLASMSGSMACIAGGIMAVYVSMGVPASYLLAASIMAVPGALVISKIVWPETEQSATKGRVKLEVKKVHANLLDAIAHGAADGLRVSLNVIAMLIAFIALIALVNAILFKAGIWLAAQGASLNFIGIDLHNFSLDSIFGALFSVFAWAMGVPRSEIHTVGSLLGTKLVINEFVAYSKLSPMIATQSISPKALIITSFALCGFANFSSIAIQVGGIGELAPERRKDLAKLGFKALICGTLASYLSATIAGILL